MLFIIVSLCLLGTWCYKLAIQIHNKENNLVIVKFCCYALLQNSSNSIYVAIPAR